MPRPTLLTRCAIAAAAGLALVVASEPLAIPWTIPFAVAGFALATLGLRPRAALLPGLVFGVAFYFPHIWWMRAVGPDAWLALAAIEATFYGLLGAAVPVLARLRAWPLWFASGWAAMEVVRSGWPFSGMPWGRLSFAVVDTPVAQALPYVGAVGVSFLLALLGGCLADLLRAFLAGSRRVLPAATVVGLATLLCAPALFPWADRAASEGRFTVAAVQGDVPGPGNDILFDHEQVTRNHVDATIELGRAVAAGERPEPDLVVWPENSTAVDPFSDGGTNAGIRAAAVAVDTPLLVGAIVDAGEEHVLNQGIVWDPVTGAGDRYTKWHPVPYGEYIPFRSLFNERTFGRLALIPRDMLSGTRTEPLRVGDVELADAICFDIAYDDGLHAQVTRGAQLLTVQTSNATFIFTDQIDQQFAITRLRAIETGRWVVVAATNGVSGVIAPDGSVVASAAPRTQEVVVEDVELIGALTPAMRLGPWPARLFILLSVLGLVAGAVAYRRARDSAGSERPPAQAPTRKEAHVG